MSMEVPMSGRVPAVVGEVGNARQLPDRNARPRPKKSPPSGRSDEPETFDPPEPAADSAEIDAGDDGGTGDLSLAAANGSTLTDSTEIEAGDDGDADDLSLATANGLTLTDVKATYDSN